MSDIRQYIQLGISAPAPTGLASGHFWQKQPNLARAKFLGGFGSCSKTAVHANYLQLTSLCLSETERFELLAAETHTANHSGLNCYNE